MASTTITSLDPALKQLYKPDNYRNSTYKRRPIFGLLPKSEDFGGRNQPLVNEYGNPQGVSSVFSTAQSNATAMKLEDFLLTRVSLHSVATMDSEAIEATGMDKYAFIKGLSAKIDGAMKALSDTIESYLPRSGTGAIGQISASEASVADTTVTLADINDAHNFEVGMRLATATSETAAVSTGSATGEVLAGVNRATGVLTCTSAAWNTVITGIAAGDYLFRHGDAYNNDANKVFTGFQGWLPSTVAGGDSFFGVNRSSDSRLYGNYYDGSALSIEEAVINGQSVGASMSAQIDTGIMHHAKMRRFKLEIGTKETFQKSAQAPGGKMAEVSYEAIRVAGDAGTIDFVAANKCPPTNCFLLELDTWVFATLGPAVKLNDLDGNRILRQSSSDGVEVRIVSRGNVGCKAPGHNVRVLLPS